MSKKKVGSGVTILVIKKDIYIQDYQWLNLIML